MTNMSLKTTIIFVSLVLFWSCRGKNGEQTSTTTKQAATEAQDYWAKNNCLRSVPEMTLDSTMLKNYSFELFEDHGKETGSWANGDSLIIISEGCELYWFAYTYIIHNYDSDLSNLDLVKYCFTQMQHIERVPINFDKGLAMLDKIQKGGGTLKLGREYFLKMDRVSEMFEIEEIDFKKEYAVVKFSFAIGHL